MQTRVIQIGSRMPLTDGSVPVGIQQAVLHAEGAGQQTMTVDT
jgi:hypothetical protein